ncbi:metallophosphoesterase [Streptomyces sp. NBC_01408]|uniref:metallophosphoesterase n=1 Tax=Streptomyces sp. NBC_01408 TaxID=2903855 RepID=UPI002B1DD652|nr:metallophosphoesterase [Streptomyces sp. NBC_01408]
MAPANLLGISDLHVSHPENRKIVANLRPTPDDDWLLVAGDAGELIEDIEWALSTLRDHFAKVVWAPGNHELWTPREDPVHLRGEERCRVGHPREWRRPGHLRDVPRRVLPETRTP